MATRNWVGGASFVNRVQTATPANVEVGDVFTLTLGSYTVSFTATVATVANVTAGLTAAWNASECGAMQEITATDSTTHVTLTGDSTSATDANPLRGQYFNVTGSATDGGGANTQTLTMATTTAGTGPYDFNNANNWDEGVVPVNGDSLIFRDTDWSLRYGLDQSGSTFATVDVFPSFTGHIGLPFLNVGNSNSGRNKYREHRMTALTCGITGLGIGIIGQPGVGSQLLRFNTGAVQTLIKLLGNAVASAEPNEPQVLWTGTHTDNELRHAGGNFGTHGTCTLKTITSDAKQVGSLHLNSGLTIGTGGLRLLSGRAYINTTVSTFRPASGSVFVLGPGGSVTTWDTDYALQYTTAAV